jgi:hypothetical protein
MNTHRDDLQAWTADWQAALDNQASAEQIRRYVSKRSGLFWSFAVADCVVGGLALPVLVYLGVTTNSDIERLAMLSLASITIAAVIFGWWNRRGVLRSSATTIAEYVAISAERLRRMRTAARIGWLVLVAEVVFFSIWIWDRVNSGARSVTRGEEIFAWSWLALFTVIGAAGLIAFGRWLDRDAARFAGMRAELEGDYDSSAASTNVGDSTRTRSAGARAIKNPRRPPLT